MRLCACACVCVLAHECTRTVQMCSYLSQTLPLIPVYLPLTSPPPTPQLQAAPLSKTSEESSEVCPCAELWLHRLLLHQQ